MSDWDAARLDPIYRLIGADTVVTTKAGSEVTLRMIDKTAGVAVSLGDIAAQTVKPAAVVRMTEVAEAGLVLEDIDDGQLDLAGSRWRIRGYLLRPGIGGEAVGEAYLLLADEKLA